MKERESAEMIRMGRWGEIAQLLATRNELASVSVDWGKEGNKTYPEKQGIFHETLNRFEQEARKR